MLSQFALLAPTAKGTGWLQEGVNCKLTGNSCNETVRKCSPQTMTRQKLNWQLQPFLIIIKAACFFSLTRDSQWQLLMETLIGSPQIALGLYTSTYWEKKKKKNPLLALFLTWCSSHKPKARRLKFTFADCEPPINVHCDPKIPPSSGAVCSLVYCWPGQSQLVPLTWTRGQKLLLCQFGHHYSWATEAIAHCGFALRATPTPTPARGKQDLFRAALLSSFAEWGQPLHLAADGKDGLSFMAAGSISKSQLEVGRESEMAKYSMCAC